MNSAKKEQLFGGAKRGGKSVALCQKIIALSMAFPGNRGILARQNLTDLKDTTLVTFWLVCPPNIVASHHKTDKIITFTNGSWFSYRGLGDTEDLEKIKGMDVGWIAIDEPSEIELSVYLMLLAQLNWVLPDGRRPAYMTLLACNPEPGWVKERFIDEGDGPDREFIPSLARDNPGLPADYIPYLLANFPKEWVDKYVNGSWEISEGMVYKAFDKDVHGLDFLPGDLKEYKIYGSLDPAPATITCMTHIAVDKWFNHILIWTYYRGERMLQDHAADMIDRIAWYAHQGLSYEYTLIDPSSNQRTNVRSNDEQLQSIRELYADQGLHCMPAWNSLEGGIERVKALLHISPNHAHPITGELGAPHFYYLKGAPGAIEVQKEFQAWKRKVDSNGVVKYSGVEPHALDTIRYTICSRPKPPEITARDEAAMTSLQRHANRSHRRWAQKFDKQVKDQAGGNNDYFAYLDTFDRNRHGGQS